MYIIFACVGDDSRNIPAVVGFSTHTLSPDSVIFVCTKNLSWRHPHLNQRSIHMNALRTSSTNLLPAGRRRGRNKMGTSSDDDNLSGEEQEIKLHCLEMDGSDAEDAPFDEIMSENSENSDKSEDINTDTDDDTLTDILGGPYAPPEQREETTVENDATVVHLKYIIPKEIPIEESVSKHSRMRNPFRRLSFMRGKDKESDTTHSTSPKPKFKAPKLFRRKKKRCSSEDSPTTSTTTSESMLLAGDYPRVSVGLLETDSDAIARKEAETEVTVRDMKKSTSKRAFGSRLEWTKTSGNSKRMFRIRSFRRKGAKTKSTASSIALEGSSDASSIFSKCSYSFDSGSEIISVSRCRSIQQSQFAPALTQLFAVSFQ